MKGDPDRRGDGRPNGPKPARRRTEAARPGAAPRPQGPPQPGHDGGERLRRGRLTSLWFGLLAGPVAWGVQLPIVYTLAVWSCDRVGFAWLHVVSILCLVAAGFGAYVSWVNLNALGEAGQASPDARRMISLLGIMSGALFAIVVLCSWFAVFLLSPCPA